MSVDNLHHVHTSHFNFLLYLFYTRTPDRNHAACRCQYPRADSNSICELLLTTHLHVLHITGCMGGNNAISVAAEALVIDGSAEARAPKVVVTVVDCSCADGDDGDGNAERVAVRMLLIRRGLMISRFLLCTLCFLQRYFSLCMVTALPFLNYPKEYIVLDFAAHNLYYGY